MGNLFEIPSGNMDILINVSLKDVDGNRYQVLSIEDHEMIDQETAEVKDMLKVRFTIKTEVKTANDVFVVDPQTMKVQPTGYEIHSQLPILEDLYNELIFKRRSTLFQFTAALLEKWYLPMSEEGMIRKDWTLVDQVVRKYTGREPLKG